MESNSAESKARYEGRGDRLYCGERVVAEFVGPNAAVMAARCGHLLRFVDVAGVAGPGAPLLVLRAPEQMNAGNLDELCTSIRETFQGPVVLVPHGWTQAQIDEAAVRAARSEGAADMRERAAEVCERVAMCGDGLRCAGGIRALPVEG